MTKYIIIAALLLSTVACRNKSEYKAIIDKGDEPAGQFALGVSTNVLLSTSDSSATSLYLYNFTKEPLHFKLSVAGVPEDTKVIYDKDITVTPNDSSIFFPISFMTRNEQAGTYTIPVTAIPDSGTAAKVDIKLHVIPL